VSAAAATRRHEVLRRIALVLLVAFALTVSLAAAGIGYVRSAEPKRDRTVRLDALAGPVDIWWDTLAVPHILATTEEDVLFAQGWAHAQDRLWQMELFRRVAEGRLSEVLGEDLLETDRFLRAIGVWDAAGTTESMLDPESLRRLRAYASGVNAYLEERRGALPPEFVALRVRPEPWTVRHSLAIEKLMAWDLSSYWAEVELARAVRRLGPERARWLGVDYGDWGTTILDEPPTPPEPPARAIALLDAVSIRRASNSWVIDGELTASGLPILANDMHLALRSPGVWYLVALHGGGYHVTGMSLPGAPFVVAGHSRAVAWGFTNAMTDDIDFFVERVDPEDPNRYLTPDGPAPFEVSEDTIRVKGLDEPVVQRVRRTRHGPVLSDVDPDFVDGDSLVVAMQWAAYSPSSTFRALPAMNRAPDAAAFREALREFDNPHQNVVFADTTGEIGYQMAGHVPLRGDRRPPPSLPVPGWTGEHDWDGRLPFDEHPAALDGDAPFVVTANNRQIAGEAGALISSAWEAPFRAERITQMIVEAESPIDVRYAHAMQLDVVDLHAASYRDHAIDAALAIHAEDVATELEQWDSSADVGSTGAGLFYGWYYAFGRQLARDLHGDAGGYMPRRTVDHVLEQRLVPWREDGGMAYDELSVAAAREAFEPVRGRPWGELHGVAIRHAMGEVRILDRLLGLNIGPHPLGGSQHTVNVSQFEVDTFPVVAQYGPSQRHVVDMSDVDGAGGFILPTGQSGVPTSEHYDDQHDQWVRGGLWLIPLDTAAARARSLHHTRLRPEDWRREDG